MFKIGDKVLIVKARYHIIDSELPLKATVVKIFPRDVVHVRIGDPKHIKRLMAEGTISKNWIGNKSYNLPADCLIKDQVCIVCNQDISLENKLIAKHNNPNGFICYGSFCPLDLS